MSVDAEAARALLAGFLSGVAGGFAATTVVMVAILRDPAWRGRLPAGLSAPAIGIVAVNAMLLAWSLAGLVLGAVQLEVGSPRTSLIVAVAVGGTLVATMVVRGRPGWPSWALAAIAIAAFAVMLPALAATG